MGIWRVIGLISGTSMDAVDVAVTELWLDGTTVHLRAVDHDAFPYPEWLRARLRAALPPAPSTAAELCVLDNEVGRHFARAADHGLRMCGDRCPDLVSSLGQTLYHWVEDGRCRGTLQIGQSAWIAEATGLAVVSDLRSRDVAAGGHGAPLAGLLDALWLSGLQTSDLAGTPIALNIGGIANITVPSPDGTVFAFDTGPGNALLDLACDMRTGTRQDTGGALAARGSVRTDLLHRLLADPYYSAAAPKSTGKEHFNAAYLDAALDGLPEVTDADLLATLVDLTARTIAAACAAHAAGTVVASGGGVHNPTLTTALRQHLSAHGAQLRTSDELSLPVDGKEAHLSALLGFLSWHSVPANLPRATGARGPRVLGSITPGREPLARPDPVPDDAVPHCLQIHDRADAPARTRSTGTP